MYQQHMLLKKEGKPFLNERLSSIMPIIFASLQHVKLPINDKIHVTIWQIVYINMTALLSSLI